MQCESPAEHTPYEQSSLICESRSMMRVWRRLVSVQPASHTRDDDL